MSREAFSCKMQVYSLSWTLLLWALTNPGAHSTTNYIKCDENQRFTCSETPKQCKRGKGFFIEDIMFTRNSRRGGVGKASFSEKNFEAAIRRDCSRKRICEMTSSLAYIKRYKYDDGSLPIRGITLEHHCKPMGPKYYKNEFDMCGFFEKKIDRKNPIVLVLESQSIVKTECTLKSLGDKKPISLRTLQVDFGRECDTSSDCESRMEITRNKNTNKNATLHRFDKRSTKFNGSNIELNIVMQTGLVWLEVSANSPYTIDCKNNSDCNDDNSADRSTDIEDESSGDGEHEDDDNENGDSDNGTIIALSLIAAFATVILICVCAVSVCRVHLRVGVIQRWLPSKPQAASDHTRTDAGHRSGDMVNQGSTSATTPSHTTKTSAPTFITKHDQRDYCEIVTVSRSSTHSNDVQVVSLPGTRRRSSSSQHEDDKNPYSELEGNEMNIPGSDGTLGEAQTPEKTNPSPIDKQGSVSSTPRTSGNSTTFQLIGLEFEEAEECNTTAAMVESDYYLASNSVEKPSNSPNELYSTLEPGSGAYSHLRPKGQQEKITSNIYNG